MKMGPILVKRWRCFVLEIYCRRFIIAEAQQLLLLVVDLDFQLKKIWFPSLVKSESLSLNLNLVLKNYLLSSVANDLFCRYSRK